MVTVLFSGTVLAEATTLDDLTVVYVYQTSQATIFAEKSDRTFGLKIVTFSTILVVGDIVHVVGDITVVDGQKVINTPTELTKTGHRDDLPRSLAVSEKSLIEACNSRGCPMSGLRITTWARVIKTPTRIDPYFGYYYILLDDGTEVYNPQDRSIGYRVCYKASDFPDLDLSEGDFCVVRGVVESLGHTSVPVLTNNLPVIWADSIEKQ
jgi:hypothetical protein